MTNPCPSSGSVGHRQKRMRRAAFQLLACLMLSGAWLPGVTLAAPLEVHRVTEIQLRANRTYANPFVDVQVDAVARDAGGTEIRVPGYWAGGNRWIVRLTATQPGRLTWRTECSEPRDTGLHGQSGAFEFGPNRGANPLYRRGPVRVADDRRHLAHADGTPFFWLGDTWWKGLCGRLPFAGFRELTADRRAKGFTVVQIVAGPLPDEPPFDARWGNEGGLPYLNDYEHVNPAFFDQADRRIFHLIEQGLMPAIVGGWGWHMPSIGVERLTRHWRYLIARYGAYPVAWIVGGEAGGPEWTAVARAVRAMDPFHRLTTVHPYNSGRQSLTDDRVLDLDMLQTGHGGAWKAYLGDYAGVVMNTVAKVTSHYAKTPTMPVLVGEVTYEAHMQSNGPDIQRLMFWSSMLSGAAGHTYGAGGLWQMNSATERGAEYEFTPWFEAMRLPGGAQIARGKRLLEELPWWRFKPHPEWVEPHGTTLLESHPDWYDDTAAYKAAGAHWDLPYAAGIPGEARVIYVPGHYYDWTAPTVKGLEPGVPYHAFLYDPALGERYALGTVVNAGPEPPAFEENPSTLLGTDSFDRPTPTGWRDHGTATRIEYGRLVGGPGMVTVFEKVNATNAMAAVTANSDAEAGVILRFQDPDHYLVGLYTPSLKALYLHDRRGGQWGSQLGRVEVPEIGPRIRLALAAEGSRATLVLTDGQRRYATPVVEVTNTKTGPAGLWLYQIGKRQEYDDFKLAPAQFNRVQRTLPGIPTAALARRPNEQPLVMHENPNIVPRVSLPPITFVPGPDWRLPRFPAPQDWVIVLTRLAP